MTQYTRRDAQRDTGATPREVREAHHAARDDASARSPEPNDRPTEVNRREGREMTERVIERARERERSGERER